MSHYTIKQSTDHPELYHVVDAEALIDPGQGDRVVDAFLSRDEAIRRANQRNRETRQITLKAGKRLVYDRMKLEVQTIVHVPLLSDVDYHVFVGHVFSQNTYKLTVRNSEITGVKFVGFASFSIHDFLTDLGIKPVASIKVDNPE